MVIPKAERDDAFYQDAFTSASTWGPGVFEEHCADHGIDVNAYSFGQVAYQLWMIMTDEEKAIFISDYDDWIDS
jgi:hypothetical protein